jgi:hypothetical protein
MEELRNLSSPPHCFAFTSPDVRDICISRLFQMSTFYFLTISNAIMADASTVELEQQYRRLKQASEVMCVKQSV